MSELRPDLRALLGAHARLVATAMEGVQVVTTEIIEAFESGDLDYARELIGIIDDNVGNWRKTFQL